MDANAELALYEQLSLLNGDDDRLIDTLMSMLGVEVINGREVVDPADRDNATKVARRWLRDHGHLPNTRRAPVHIRR